MTGVVLNTICSNQLHNLKAYFKVIILEQELYEQSSFTFVNVCCSKLEVWWHNV